MAEMEVESGRWRASECNAHFIKNGVNEIGDGINNCHLCEARPRISPPFRRQQYGARQTPQRRAASALLMAIESNISFSMWRR